MYIKELMKNTFRSLPLLNSYFKSSLEVIGWFWQDTMSCWNIPPLPRLCERMSSCQPLLCLHRLRSIDGTSAAAVSQSCIYCVSLDLFDHLHDSKSCSRHSTKDYGRKQTVTCRAEWRGGSRQTSQVSLTSLEMSSGNYQRITRDYHESDFWTHSVNRFGLCNSFCFSARGTKLLMCTIKQK